MNTQDFLRSFLAKMEGTRLNVFEVADACNFPAHDLLNILRGHRVATPREQDFLLHCELTNVYS